MNDNFATTKSFSLVLGLLIPVPLETRFGDKIT